MGDITFTATNPTGPVVTCGLVGNPSYGRHGGTSGSGGGGGGIQVIDRALQKAATEWLDFYPLVMSIDCILDGGPAPAASVEPSIAILESYEVPAPGSAPPQPPQILIQGPVPHNEITWWCSRLAFTGGEDGAMRDPSSGERTQQTFTIELTEYSPSTVVISGLSPAEQAQQAASAKP